MKIRGKIRKEDVEGGVFLVEVDGGEVYQIAGGDPRLRKEGLSVELEGDVDDEAVGIEQMAPTFKVKSWKAR